MIQKEQVQRWQVQAACWLPMDGSGPSPGWMTVEGENVVDCGRGTLGRNKLGTGRVDLDGMILLPGLINAHCHLDYTRFGGQLSAAEGFAGWIKGMNALKRATPLEQFKEGIEEGFAQLLEYGVTSVVNIEAFPELISQITPPLRTWWAVEGIDLGRPFDFPRLPEPFCVSPHAPYTASRKLYTRSKRLAQESGALVTTHVAESVEEWDMFAEGAGPLFEMMRALGRDMGDCRQGRGPLGLLLEEDCLPERTLLVHGNHVLPSDAGRCARARHAVVHCPQTHAYFGREPFPWKLWREAGVEVMLGTDSLASAGCLSLLEEARLFCRAHGGCSPKEAIEMVTRTPGRFLDPAGRLGRGDVGAWADWIAVPWDGKEDPYEAVLRHEGPVPWVMVGGRILRGAKPEGAAT
jgi:cytosine/adenosine deaminase-related metal-dependent hydrolase